MGLEVWALACNNGSALCTAQCSVVEAQSLDILSTTGSQISGLRFRMYIAHPAPDLLGVEIFRVEG